MAGSSEPAFLFLSIKMELLLHRLFIYFATAPSFIYFLRKISVRWLQPVLWLYFLLDLSLLLQRRLL